VLLRRRLRDFKSPSPERVDGTLLYIGSLSQGI
jgi:hypothetical protein